MSGVKKKDNEDNAVMDRFSYLAEMSNGALGVAWYKFVRLKTHQARDYCVASNRKPNHSQQQT